MQPEDIKESFIFFLVVGDPGSTVVNSPYSPNFFFITFLSYSFIPDCQFDISALPKLSFSPVIILKPFVLNSFLLAVDCEKNSPN